MLVQHTRTTGVNESEIVTTSVQTSKIIFRHPKSRSGGRHHTIITQTRLLCSRFVCNCSSRMKPRLKPISGSLHPFCSCRMSVLPLGASSSQASSTSHALVAPSPPSSTTIIHHITAAPSSAAALANTLKPPTLFHACLVLKVQMSSKSKSVKLAAARAAAALSLRLTVSEFALLKLRESFVKGQVTLSVCLCECQWRRHC